MTNTTMKSKEVSPSTRRASMPTSYKNKIAVHPQWMRTLEEKYQKLHLKITRNASFMNNIQNTPNITRNYYDTTNNIGTRAVYNRLRADKVAQKYREQVKSSSNMESGIPKSKLFATDITDPVTLVRKNMEYPDNENVSKCTDKTADENENVLNEVQREERVLSAGDQGDIISEVEIIRKKNNLNDNTRLINEHEKNHLKPGIKPKIIKNVHVVQPVDWHNKLYKKELAIKRENTCKTSTSRYSNNTLKTTKSCPATMQKISHEPPSRLMPRQCISACARSPRKCPPKRRLKSFMGMSMEAQHAMTETIKAVEPDIAKEKDNSLPGDFEYTKEPFSDCEQEEEEYEENGNENLNWNYVSLNDNNNENTETYVNEVYSDSELSVSTQTRPFTSKTQPTTRLPEISPDQRPYESLSNLQQLQHLRYRLPGIGNYDIPLLKENTFEITPPGFDIRYKDIPVFEENESETPPPEIKDRAVQKCQEWLSRFTPRPR